MAGKLWEIGLLTEISQSSLAAYCQAYGRWVQAERSLATMAKRDPSGGGLLIKTSNGNVIQNPLVGIANKAAEAMVRYAGEFGMTPSSRGRIKLDEDGIVDRQPMGKKEIAEENARTAGVGTDWGDDLTPPASSLN